MDEPQSDNGFKQKRSWEDTAQGGHAGHETTTSSHYKGADGGASWAFPGTVGPILQ